MNKTAIKNFAVAARITLIDAVTQKAYEYGVTENGKNDPAQTEVNGNALTTTERNQRSQLISRIQLNGFAQTMEEAAYTWFNRFIALRFMEVNGYLPSRVRVFTDENGAFKPEILSEAMNVEIDGLNREYVLELLDLQDNDELYKYLLITQCNALHDGLSEMFEKIGGWTELLFPNNLLRNDSVIAHMVEDIPEEDWTEQVQIIGWLYQYYNSEPKNKVFENLKKNVKISAENIPAATQLFTPDWIVRYMVENSLGRLWTEGHGKPKNADWKYYLDEAEQEDSVKAELEKLRTEYKSIQPEQIRFLDPCMGSGHILVYAFDVLMQIYMSIGWSERDAAKSILQHNLYGLDIDKRAYQLAYFAVMMKARQYNRRILTSGVQPNLAHFQDISKEDTAFLDEPLRSFAEQFRYADTYGSLMSVAVPEGIDDAISSFTGMINFDAEKLEQMMRIYRILSQKYDVVVTNPPYMGGSGMNAALSDFVKKNFPDSKSDLFACFIEKCGQLAKENGFYAMITQHAWMFLSSYENLRKKLMIKTTVNMAHLGARAFDEIGGEVVQTTAFVQTGHIADYKGTYVRLVDIVGENEKCELFLSGEKRYNAKQENFSKIPGSPVAYWVSGKVFTCFEKAETIDNVSYPRQGLATGNNDLFLRMWHEVDVNDIKFDATSQKEFFETGLKYVPYNKGGSFRKWFANMEFIIHFDKKHYDILATVGNHLPSRDFYFRESITWSKVTSGGLSMRYIPNGSAFDVAGCSIFCDENLMYMLGFVNSCVMQNLMNVLSQTLNYEVGSVKSIPIIYNDIDKVESLVEENVAISKIDLMSYETHSEFERHPLV